MITRWEMAISILSSFVAVILTWNYQATKYEAKLSEVQLSYSKRDFKALEAQYADTIRLQKKAEDAQAKAAVRIRTLAADRDLLRGAVDGLRGDLATGNGATDTGASGIEYAATVRAVLSECAGEIGELASKADGHASDVMMLKEAWPR